MSAKLKQALDRIVDSSAPETEDLVHAVCKAVAHDKRFTGLNEDIVANTVNRVMQDPVADVGAAVEKIHTSITQHSSGISKLLAKPAEDLVAAERATASHAYKTSASHSTRAYTTAPHAVPVNGGWSALNHGEKLNTAVSLLAAGISAAGAWSCASQAVQTDSDGKRHLNPGMAGLAILQGAFAAGLAYMSAQAIHGGLVR